MTLCSHLTFGKHPCRDTYNCGECDLSISGDVLRAAVKYDRALQGAADEATRLLQENKTLALEIVRLTRKLKP